ncbi:MAG: transposase [Candidatus Thiodiazotropha sp. (ex Gloverina cf. vestifex)]|nr:transposase [Candidatus Thiodiazotropha sp. (ex Gloverina cf. vestifex)]
MARRKHYNIYDDQFKATAVALTNIQGVKATDVAEALFIHPVMLYRWRLETRNGTLMATKKDINIDPKMRAELKRLCKIEREHNLLKQEHDLLKKAIQFSLERKKKSSNLSTPIEDNTL